MANIRENIMAKGNIGCSEFYLSQLHLLLCLKFIELENLTIKTLSYLSIIYALLPNIHAIGYWTPRTKDGHRVFTATVFITFQ